MELRAEGDKLLFRPSERVTEGVKAKLREHKAEVLALLTEAETLLAETYKAYWRLPESEPLERFQAVRKEIVKLESKADPQTAWRTLRETTRAWHRESGICPFCRERGDLHLPAEQLQQEL